MLSGKGRAGLFVLLPVIFGTAAVPSQAAVYEPPFTYKLSADALELVREPELPPPPLLPLSLIIEPVKLDMTHVEPSLLKRMFRTLAAAVMPSEALASDEPQSAISAPKGKGMMAQEFDPNFQLWQERAQEKLKDEEKLRVIGPHRLAAAYPNDYVVVCEAGCLKQPEEIVFQVAKVESSAVVTRLDTNSALTDKSVAQEAVPEGARMQEPDTILCVAGCYESPKVHSARLKTVEVKATGGAKTTVAESTRKSDEAPLQIAAAAKSEQNGVRAAAVLTTLRNANSMHRPWTMRAPTKESLQIRTIYEVPTKAALRQRAMPKKPAQVQTAGVWRTRIVFAKQPKAVPLINGRPKRLAQLTRLKQVLQPIRNARLKQYAIVETRY